MTPPARPTRAPASPGAPRAAQSRPRPVRSPRPLSPPPQPPGPPPPAVRSSRGAPFRRLAGPPLPFPPRLLPPPSTFEFSPFRAGIGSSWNPPRWIAEAGVARRCWGRAGGTSPFASRVSLPRVCTRARHDVLFWACAAMRSRRGATREAAAPCAWTREPPGARTGDGAGVRGRGTGGRKPGRRGAGERKGEGGACEPGPRREGRAEGAPRGSAGKGRGGATASASRRAASRRTDRDGANLARGRTDRDGANPARRRTDRDGASLARRRCALQHSVSPERSFGWRFVPLLSDPFPPFAPPPFPPCAGPAGWCRWAR